jgi:hypothetical protein
MRVDSLKGRIPQSPSVTIIRMVLMNKMAVHTTHIGSSNPSRVEGKSSGSGETHSCICAWGVYRRQRIAKEATPAKKMMSRASLGKAPESGRKFQRYERDAKS